MLARNGTLGIELRQVDLWRDAAIGIDATESHTILFNCYTLHSFPAQLDIQKGVDFSVLRHDLPNMEFAHANGGLSYELFLFASNSGRSLLRSGRQRFHHCKETG